MSAFHYYYEAMGSSRELLMANENLGTTEFLISVRTNMKISRMCYGFLYSTMQGLEDRMF